MPKRRRGPLSSSESESDSEEELESGVKSARSDLVTRQPCIDAFDPTDSTVAVEVGAPVATTFNVHFKLLCSSSEFMKAKVKPEWLKNHKTVKLPDHSGSIFKIYIHWLYSRTIPAQTPVGVDKTAAMILDHQNLAAAFVLGDALLDTTFKDTVMDALVEKLRGGWVYAISRSLGAMAKTIYDGTPAGSPARKLLVEVTRRHFSGYALSENTQGLPYDFLYDLTLAFANNRVAERPVTLASKSIKCEYHSHGAEQTCYKKAKKT